MFKVEKDFYFKCLRCIVILQDMGHRCGYVGVESLHNLYGKDYYEVDCIVHGGLTYAGGGCSSVYPVLSNLWRFGFDCAHCEDARDFETTLKYFPEKRDQLEFSKMLEARYPTGGEIRTNEYVEEECKLLAKQLLNYIYGRNSN